MKVTHYMKIHWAAHELRKYAEKYLRSNKTYDNECGKTLEAIADDLISKKLESAKIRFDALHPNIKSGLPFHVLEVVDKGEMYGK